MSLSIRFRGQRHHARSLALQVLLEGARREGFVQELLDRQLSSQAAQGMSAPDRRLATHLVYGVLRRRDTLAAVLQPLLSRPAHQLEPWLWDALQLGAYQMLLLTQIPAHAALHETVELAAQFGRPQAKGFLNAVLRSCSRLILDEWVDQPAADALPLEERRYRRLSQHVLPDPKDFPGEYLACAFGLPGWLAQRWLERFGKEEAYRLGFWFAGPGPLTLRVQPLRARRELLLEALHAAGYKAVLGEHPQAIRLIEHAAIRELPGYEEGWFSVQDESAMRVASALEPAPGERVLDLCAAPGGKTTHLAELMGDQGAIVACDIDEKRLQTVRELATRLRLRSIQTVRIKANGSDVPEGPFDRVLLDVPCSNTGVLGRRPEVRSRLRPDDLRQLTRVQDRLLQIALSRVRSNGIIVYSTCSIEPEENRQRVDTLEGVQLLGSEEAVPGRPADGGYWARMRKR